MIVASIEIASGGDDSTDANVMFTFASVNTVIDLTCIGMFYSRKDDIVHNKYPSFSSEVVPPTHAAVSLHSVNINMFSAFTHIGSDTLRTLAVFGAAIVSSTTGMVVDVSFCLILRMIFVFGVSMSFLHWLVVTSVHCVTILHFLYLNTMHTYSTTSHRYQKQSV